MGGFGIQGSQYLCKTADNASDEERSPAMEEQAQDSNRGMEPGQTMEVEIMLLKFKQSVSSYPGYHGKKKIPNSSFMLCFEST